MSALTCIVTRIAEECLQSNPPPRIVGSERYGVESEVHWIVAHAILLHGAVIQSSKTPTRAFLGVSTV